MKKLIFIYNADSGVLNAAKDGIHKAVSPETYECSLCAVTYGALFKKREWEDFISSLLIESEFTYRDTFSKQFPGEEANFPSIYILTNNKLNLLASSEEVDIQKTIPELKKLVTSKLKQYI